MAPQHIQWGNITLHLDNEMFRTSFTNGRSMYFDDREYEFPHLAHHMTTREAVGSVLDEDGKGGYRFDRMAFNHPLDILGFFLGYMSGSIIAESAEEYEERHKRVVIVPEEACSTRRAL
ncbi:MAG TPA: hypothetical protein VFA41_20430 [Ktedonobacteraceae bacterium]|jgi:hypothetical protein|nr:hypothetical protein [Ktedonobacteraceae bacterium]